ncbi:hypothetical protein [Acinetobacter pullicarnis]|uniref:hypothetical protein n=1 Tax=Acinetobacter pullicarnis TaxID=2576829 RepID=UPI00111D7451|nr:hypothetical protein [Acinetobacter pullicarnis]
MNNPAQLNVATATECMPRARATKTKKKEVSLSYRGMIFYRFCLALFGGYAFASLSAMAIAQLFINDRVNAVMSATLLAFVLHCAVFIWVFMVNKTLKASLGVLVPCAVLFCILIFVGQ